MADYSQQLGQMFRQIHRRRDRVISGVMAKFSLHRAQHITLMILHNEPQLTQLELADRLEVSPAAVTVSLRNLEKRGLLCRVPDAHDSRQKRLALTEAGEALVQQSEEFFAALEKEQYGFLSEEEQRELLQLLEKISDHLVEMSGDSHKKRRTHS